ncbi:MAG: DUF1549 domain-containing protein [Planctomycetota bacterium]
MKSTVLPLVFVAAFLSLHAVVYAADMAKKDAVAAGPVSYYKQIRPIFQASCQGCHQPAKAKGGYVMTIHARMLAGGDSKDKQVAIVPKNPGASHLLQQITPVKGEKREAEMPKGLPALTDPEIALVTRWIHEGALDDTPENAVRKYDSEHPPIYTLPPVITALDFSPDGQWLAVSGFNEVLLHKADGSGLAARLIGMSERIESVRFSPDGKLLAVAGGLPGRMGEVQVWDVESRKLKVSVPVTYDTVYGASWSPDGKLVAFGGADNIVRAINVATGKQVLQQGSHNDWILDTVFSSKGDHIISVGRDMSAKLTEVATQRFVDNITSITPGALRGGLHAVASFPTEEQVLIGGADGAPQLYRVHRLTARKIGDNANLIKKYPEMTGRIYSVCFSKDGSQFAAASSLDNSGQVVVYAMLPNEKQSDKIKAILKKNDAQRSPDEKIELDTFLHEGDKQIAKSDFPGASIYALAFNPDGKSVAAAGQDGVVRFITCADGKVAKQFPVAPLAKDSMSGAASTLAAALPTYKVKTSEPEALPDGAQIASIDVLPNAIQIARPTDSIQVLVLARLATGETFDATRSATFKVHGGIAQVTDKGLLCPMKNGSGDVEITVGKASAKVPVEIAGLNAAYKMDFIHDVNPVLSKVGCNTGTCHGSKDGKNGFKLSLRGYDPIFDVRAFSDDLACRRINAASPDDSLMLLKPTGAVPHEGGQKFKLDDKNYRILRDWIAAGATLDLQSPRVEKIEIFPKDPVIQMIGSKQQVRVVAKYASGESRDVTAEAFIDSGNGDVASVDSAGLISTLRRGEAPMLARYEGNYAATTVTVMGDRSGFEWQAPPTYGRIDELVADKWKRMKILPSAQCNDSEYLRRVYLDLTGLPPSAENVTAFLADARESRVKREDVVDKLVGCPEFIEHVSNKWADLLQVNRKFLGTEGSTAFREWIYKQIEANVPYDQFARSILTATGSNKDNPPSSYFKVLRDPAETMENTTHLFLATRFNCNKCHDHPFERWTQDQYYQTAAFFAQVELKADTSSGDRKIGGTAVEGAKPLYEIVGDKKAGDVTHLRTQKVAPPTFPYPAKYELKDEDKASRRERLAAWITTADNRYFAMSYVNRLWGYLMGVGIIEPLDDIRAGNPPTNPELLDYLTKEFTQHNFDVRHVMKLICKSRTYQLTIVPNTWNADDKTNYSHATARRLPAEVLCDAVFRVTGSAQNFPGVKPGMRAAQLPDVGVDLPSGLLATLGRPVRESACECERSNDIRLGSVMSLLSGPTVSDAIDDPNNAIAKLVAAQPDDRKLVNDIYMRVINRSATDAEIATALKMNGTIAGENTKLATDLDTLEAKFKPVIAEQERVRLAGIEKVKTELAAHEKAIAPKIAEDERKRIERVAADEKALKDYETGLAKDIEVFEKKVTPDQMGTEWIALDLKTVKATAKAKLEKQKDGSVLASGDTANTDYIITIDTKVEKITGIMLEVLPDESLPNFGPGRAKDANFVLNEFKLEWSAKGGEKKMTKAKFKDAKADFTQKDFDVKATIADKFETNKGWAISGTPQGQPHHAMFALETPIGDAKGATLKIDMVQKFRDTYSIGKFRLWATTSAKPLDFGLPTMVVAILKTEKEKRTKEQNDVLAAYYSSVDSKLFKLKAALAKDKMPLPTDPKVLELRTALAKAEEPIVIDPKLVQLRQDAAMSVKQLNDKRLTGAQDLVWALINNPAFLFNH